jgi:hypothetical protein
MYVKFHHYRKSYHAERCVVGFVHQLLPEGEMDGIALPNAIATDVFYMGL